MQNIQNMPTLKTTYDVIIVGARVAGSTLAYELSKKGYDVLLLERGTFPSDVLSTHNFFNNSLAILREMGVLDRLLATNTPIYNRAYMHFEDAIIDGTIPEADGETHNLCIRRTHLDHILFDNASQQPGVTALEGFRVTNLLRENETVAGVEGIGRDGATRRFKAKLVVGADGRRSTVRRLVNAERKHCVPTDFASYTAYFSDFRQDGQTCVEMYKTGENLFIAFPTSDDLHVLGFMFPLERQDRVAKCKQNPEQALRELIDEAFPHTTIPQRLRDAKLSGSVKGLLGYDNDWYQPMGQGWALLGDARSFKDPCAGTGMHDCLFGARILANILSAHDNWHHSWDTMADAYESQLTAKLMPHFQMACQFTKNIPFSTEQRLVNRLIGSDPAATRAFLGLYNYVTKPGELEREIGRLVAGLQQK